VDIILYNQQAWDDEARKGNEWTVPVGESEIDQARTGYPHLVLTPRKVVPASWYPPLKGAKVLALASGGGQQVPMLAAAGAEVTVFDLSAEQLKRDEETCTKFNLPVKTVLGNMMDLSALPENYFDFIFHPCSNCFAPDLQPVWNGCARVLKSGGVIVWGFTKAESMLLFRNTDDSYTLKYKMPYSDLHSLNEEERSVYTSKNEPLIFGHSLEDQIAALLRNGFVLTDLYEDDWGGREPMDAYFKAFVACRAVKK
jgi:ubiquinone/menaquinone biosynthesis C-methylase UbiE